MKRISIVVPMYNEARHIGRTLDSALRAARLAELECELLVVDNGSSDDGPRLARERGARVLVHPGLAIGALRNRGAQAASGDCLAFLDADIEVPADWLCIWRQTRESDRADILALDCDTPAEAPWFARAWQRRSLSGRRRAALLREWLPTPNLCLERHWFEQVGGFDEVLRSGEDKDFGLRLGGAGARQLSLAQPLAWHWGYEGNWREWLGKELWRQGSHLQLLRSLGPSLRLLRFPLLCLGVLLLSLAAVLNLLGGHCALAAGLLLPGLLGALLLAARQAWKRRDGGLLLQLWPLHWIRLHLGGAALILSLLKRNARRPARG
ncbi:glycosyltransferase [Pseudomonas panipatensis]|uniref:Glycosyltransferase involved in cell wall bisynthesis n=1 Tax=Pseudomonas panipatensis TaxID=428992 RepID=A0A1G8IMY0_9PSED|nr:glycosyltransferase [Pseudomonas panipatensis]SDI20319.1 Glycosyltransferase involved in cell wall bisynthesis [Pseudomonas panipatensis]SMP73447.1 Glycosyltransferase involved in cell wall bisynthesis [Pseudomonas panipatensis]